MIYNAMDTKLHTLKKRLSAVASYSKNNNFFLPGGCESGSFGPARREMVFKNSAQNPDQQRVCRQKCQHANQ